jgi:hypothetical protein
VDRTTTFPAIDHNLARETAGAGLAAVSSTLQAMAAFGELWAQTFAAHAGVAAKSARAAAEKQEAKSWYRHPDGIYAAGPDSIRAGWPWIGPVLGASPAAGAAVLPVLWFSLAFGARTGWPVPGLPVGWGLASPFQGHSMDEGQRQLLESLADAMLPFASYRSDGGHAVAQVIVTPANER